MLMRPFFATKGLTTPRCLKPLTFQAQKWVCTLTQTRLSALTLQQVHSFGFNTICVDGNNIGELCDAIDEAIARSKKKCAPTCILMDTLKGAGIKSIAGDYHCHYMALDDDTYAKYSKELEEDYKARLDRVQKGGK